MQCIFIVNHLIYCRKQCIGTNCHISHNTPNLPDHNFKHHWTLMQFTVGQKSKELEEHLIFIQTVINTSVSPFGWQIVQIGYLILCDVVLMKPRSMLSHEFFSRWDIWMHEAPGDRVKWNVHTAHVFIFMFFPLPLHLKSQGIIIWCEQICLPSLPEGVLMCDDHHKRHRHGFKRRNERKSLELILNQDHKKS